MRYSMHRIVRDLFLSCPLSTPLAPLPAKLLGAVRIKSPTPYSRIHHLLLFLPNLHLIAFFPSRYQFKNSNFKDKVSQNLLRKLVDRNPKEGVRRISNFFRFFNLYPLS